LQEKQGLFFSSFGRPFTPFMIAVQHSKISVLVCTKNDRVQNVQKLFALCSSSVLTNID